MDYNTFFEQIGKYVCATNRTLDIQRLYADDYINDILSVYTPEEQKNIRTLIQDFINISQRLEGTISTIIQQATQTIAGLQKELNSPDTSPTTILTLLKERMLDDSETIKGVAIATPIISYEVGNNGNGVLLVADYDNQKIINEVVVARCTTDRWTGSPSYSRWQLVGYPINSVNSYLTQGNGVGSLNEMMASNLIINGDFETFSTTNVPDNWTDVLGSGAGVVTAEENVQVFRDTSSLMLKSNASYAHLKLSQNLELQQNQYYCMTVRLRKTGACNGSSTLTIKIDTENELLTSPITLFSADPDTLTDNFVLYNVFFKLPDARLEDQITVFIDWTGCNTVTSGQGVYIDDLLLTATTSFGNVQYVLVPGSTEFIVGDEMKITTVNNQTGLFTNFFTRFYGIELPWDVSPSISDTLASDCSSVCASGT